MSEATITVPMDPPAEVSPNWKVPRTTRTGQRRKPAWLLRSEAVLNYRTAAKYATTNALNDDYNWNVSDFDHYLGPVEVGAEIVWGKGRKLADDTNAPILIKAAIDGISDALWNSEDRHVRIGRVTQSRSEDGLGETRITLRTLQE